MNIAIISKTGDLPVSSEKWTLKQTTAKNGTEIAKFCQNNECVGFIELNDAFQYNPNFIDCLISEEDIKDDNIGYIYSDYTMQDIPVLNTSTLIIKNLPLIFIKTNYFIRFQNFELIVKNSIGRHVPEYLVNA